MIRKTKPARAQGLLRRIGTAGALVLLAILFAVPVSAQSRRGTWQPPRNGPAEVEDEGPVHFRQRDLSGPRFGVTVVTGNGELWKRMQEEEMDRMLSQFGWHFEQRIEPEGGGPDFVVEFIPMVAGVEYGTVVPSFTLAMGVRTPGGWEFGIGPNILATGFEDEDDVHTSLITAVGRSLDYGGVSIPLNVALSTSPEGTRISFIVGYAIRR